ncbi:hypothetical protein Y032_0117g661 [Ancylostoma ceylanicum]|uniref:Uncharacterized protein n=1 Tax=Ancylostoma ceylanicum TaxID=53326 RepID=A0A016TC19_9BILA|nr:hypothetical protein Y032_0117g661 [Ancylostoma ceylanicum]
MSPNWVHDVGLSMIFLTAVITQVKTPQLILPSLSDGRSFFHLHLFQILFMANFRTNDQDDHKEQIRIILLPEFQLKQ